MSEWTPDGGLTLTPVEVNALAIRLAIRQMATHPSADWLDWDELPHLTEATLNVVIDAIDTTVPNLLQSLLAQGERTGAVDSAVLLRMARHGRNGAP